VRSDPQLSSTSRHTWGHIAVLELAYGRYVLIQKYLLKDGLHEYARYTGRESR
jgi:hypothetical protein